MLTAELEAFATSVRNNAPFPTPLTEILHGVGRVLKPSCARQHPANRNESNRDPTCSSADDHSPRRPPASNGRSS